VKTRVDHPAAGELLQRLWDVQQALEELLEAGDDETVPFSEADLTGMHWTTNVLVGAVEGSILDLVGIRERWQTQFARPDPEPALARK
jgi:hypothetical protein